MTARNRRSPGLPVLLVFGALALAGCRKREEPKAVRASFGVFFGGEVQEREEVSLVLDRARQSIGIRVEFRDPPEGALTVTWELEKPRAGKDAGAGLVDYGQARTRPGEPTLDIPLAFRSGDPTGNWRVRVGLGAETILDRGFRVVPPVPTPVAEE
jgi:hypothetical protein